MIEQVVKKGTHSFERFVFGSNGRGKGTGGGVEQPAVDFMGSDGNKEAESN